MNSWPAKNGSISSPINALYAPIDKMATTLNNATFACNILYQTGFQYNVSTLLIIRNYLLARLSIISFLFFQCAAYLGQRQVITEDLVFIMPIMFGVTLLLWTVWVKYFVTFWRNSCIECILRWASCLIAIEYSKIWNKKKISRLIRSFWRKIRNWKMD